jgi:hypothetical protein
MFSALKLGVATALVAMFGGLLAISVVGPQEGQAPGAAASEAPSPTVEATLEPAAAVTGRILPGTNTWPGARATQETLPELTVTDYAWTLTVMTSDPRLNGTMKTNQTYHQVLDGNLDSGSLRSGIGHIANDDGSWAIEFTGFSKPGESSYTSPNFTLHLTGEDGYEGLSAMLFLVPVPGSHWDVDGVIIPGAMPEPPASVVPPDTE